MATKRQLFALYLASGKTHDYRNDNLTIEQASELLQSLNGKKIEKEKKGDILEKQFIDYMNEQIEGIISTARSAIKVKSVVESDPLFVKDPKKVERYAFFGFGCGFTIIDYDKRSKKGQEIMELSNKHHFSTFLKKFLEGFTKNEIKYFESVGSPLSALYAQDITINGKYENAVASFMTKMGVKNVRTRTYYD